MNFLLFSPLHPEEGTFKGILTFWHFYSHWLGSQVNIIFLILSHGRLETEMRLSGTHFKSPTFRNQLLAHCLQTVSSVGAKFWGTMTTHWMAAL